MTSNNAKCPDRGSPPSEGEIVVISGMSGRLPESNNVLEYLNHLLNKEEMVTNDDEKWNVDHAEVPKRSSKVYDIDKFDSGFFGVHYRDADSMDPTTRMFMETAIEAILDAGINPSELEGSKTGVFVSVSWFGKDYSSCFKNGSPENLVMGRFLTSMISQRLSYYLKLKGPSYVIDTACSSALNAIDVAFNYIKNGQLDYALVGAASLILDPGSTLQFFRLGVLSTDGVCRVFDQEASGYVRGETVACLFLQKDKNSRRIYARIINTKVNTNGFTEQGITFPLTQIQEQLMTEIYQESGIAPSEISYLEAHGTATEVGDPEEVKAIDRALAQKRDKPLLVGSVKSNIGHTEIASGLCSVIKVLLAFETGLITPNINLNQIKKGMKGFEEGRMRVVTEVTKFEEENAIMGINNFGFGGNNAHIILKRHPKKKSDCIKLYDDIPRLVCVSGRTQKAIEKLLNDINSQDFDVEYIGLLHQIFKVNFPNHSLRGYTIISKTGIERMSSKIWFGNQLPFYVIFGPFNTNFRILGWYLSECPIFKETASRINKILVEKTKKTLEDILTIDTDNNYNMLGSICIQIAVVDILKSLDVAPTAVYANSYSKLVSAYYYNVISFEEAVLGATQLIQCNADSNSQVQNIIKNESISNNLLNHDLLNKLGKNAVILNIADMHLNNRDLLIVEENVVNLLNILGRLFEEGYTPQLHRLYPEVKFPVSRKTPMISPTIQWHHEKSWYTYHVDKSVTEIEPTEFEISLLLDEYKFIAGHVINNRNLFPATEYLYLVWQTFAESHRSLENDLPVVFTHCKFIKAVTMPQAGFVKLLITIQPGSGKFEVLEKDSLIVSGYIQIGETIRQQQSTLQVDHFKEAHPSTIIEKDEIYRELYLRGYNYSGLFKGLEKCSVDTSTGLLKWKNNWATFMDTMLQMKILEMDTRLLYVPIGIKKLSIDPLQHLRIVKEQKSEEPLIPVHVYRNTNIIKSGGIEICGLQAKSISKKVSTLKPVLEKHQFIPNCAVLNLLEALRVNVQIILENTSDNQFTALEIFDECKTVDYEFLLHSICNIFEDIPMVTTDLTISSKTAINEVPGVKVENVTLTVDSNFLLIIGRKLLQRTGAVRTLSGSLNKNGFLLTREDLDFVSESVNDIEVVTEYATPKEKLILFRLKGFNYVPKTIEVSSSQFEWLSPLQDAIKNENNVVIYSNKMEPEGILGLVNCIRREPKGNKIKCFFMMNESPEFDPENMFYKNQIRKNLAVNIYKNSTWGTYRHLSLEKVSEVKCEHCYLNSTNRGDISSLRWFEGSLNKDTPLPKGKILVSTYYSALNFKDIMIASGRLEAASTNRLEQECPIGLEFSGRDLNGRRVTGMVTSQALASLVVADSDFLWNIPDAWSLEDAATVPVVYATVMYALFVVGNLPFGSSILIHSATGGIGLAALNVCLHYKCDIYVTVGTQEKRDYLKLHYPQIPDSHIGNSRDISFEEMINTQTKGRGVDFVLNSLTDEKLKASVRCLARGGQFMEIGKFDLANDTSLNLLFMEREASYHGVFLDLVFSSSPEKKINLMKLVEEGIKSGFVKPLHRTVFNREEYEASFRYMMTGKHIGKVIIKLRDEEKKKVVIPTEMTFVAERRFTCDIRYSYVVIGGLGGVGLELADWLVLRGAKKLILVSRSGIQNGYQRQRIGLWESYGVDVRVSIKDVTSKEGCSDMLIEANRLGPVDGIFNLAVVLKDALFEEQSEESFLTALAPKAQATRYLDQLSKLLCPQLRYFVIFSSVSCGRGNAGQTNYGMANSIMERICEKRKHDGLPAVAIQWGAIGDVGLVVKMQKENRELVIGGTLQQKISSCLEVLDTFLKQEHPVVSSMVVAEKHNTSYGIVSPVEAVAQILGIKDLKTISQHSTLAELGMDSMMGTEVIQTLETEFEIFVTAKDVRSLTVAKLIEMEVEKKPESKEKDVGKLQLATDMLINYVTDTKDKHLPIVSLNSEVAGSENIVFLLPGVEGSFKQFEMLSKHMLAEVLGVQYNYDQIRETVEDVATNIYPHVEKKLAKNSRFFLICYSYGTVVGLELASLLERNGYVGKIVAIDGSPTYLQSTNKKHFAVNIEGEFETDVLNKIFSVLIPLETLSQNKEKCLQCINLSEKIDFLLTLLPANVANREQIEKQAIVAMYHRFKSVNHYTFSHQKIKSEVHLVKVKYPMVEDEEDYQLSKYCEKKVKLTTIDGDHATVLNQLELANYLNEIILK